MYLLVGMDSTMVSEDVQKSYSSNCKEPTMSRKCLALKTYHSIMELIMFPMSVSSIYIILLPLIYL